MPEEAAPTVGVSTMGAARVSAIGSLRWFAKVGRAPGARRNLLGCGDPHAEPGAMLWSTRHGPADR
ncbi:hypothetical protein SKB0092_07420 [Roseomonas mucosa]